jgi:hypothetical protein
MTDALKYAFIGGITKSRDDKGHLHVKGLATDATLDLDDQICDPAWLNAEFPAWFKNHGNVREMHQLKAVGKAMEMSTKGSGFEIDAKIVDKSAAEKVDEGIYTGFSIGIKGARVDKSAEALAIAPGGIINGGKIIEVSLVDVPANPNARLELAKTVGEELVKTEVITDGTIPCANCSGTGEVFGDGGVTQTCSECGGSGEDEPDIVPSLNGGPDEDGEIGINDAGKSAEDESEKAAETDLEKKEFSDKERADLADKGQAMPDGSYPIRNAGDLKNAIQAYGRAKNPAAVKRHIITRARALGKLDELPEDWNVKKAAFFDALLEINELSKAADPGQWKHDPAKLAAIRDGLVEFAQAELGEFASGDDERWDVMQLTDALNTFLSWWQDEAQEGETTSPFGKDDTMDYLALGIQPDIVKAATSSEATDTDKDALKAEFRKALGLEDVDTIQKSLEAAVEKAAEDASRIAVLEAELADVKKMAAPKGISLRATQFQQSRFAEVEKLAADAVKYRAVASTTTDPADRAAYMKAANEAQTMADSIRKSLEGDN